MDITDAMIPAELVGSFCKLNVTQITRSTPRYEEEVQLPDDLDHPLQDQSWFSFANVVSRTELSDYGTHAPLWVRSNGSMNLAPPIGNRALASTMTSAPSGKRWSPGRAPIGGAGQLGPASGTNSLVTVPNGATVETDGRSAQSLTFTGTTGTLKLEDALSFTGSISGLAGADAVGTADISPVTIANGAAVEIDGPSARSVAFAGTTGTLKLEDPQAFAGLISGLSGADAIDLSGFAYGANVTATYLGNATGGTLTVTEGTKTARVALSGNYLSSSWTLSSDGKGGTVVVDPNWQDLKVGGGGFVRGLDIAPDGTMVGRTDTNGAYLWNGSAWVQLVTASSMPAAFDFTSGGQGVYEIQIADSNTNIFYMQYDGYIFKSTNKGTTWTQTAFAQQTADNSNDSYGQVGQKMAIDPSNPNIVYAGTETAGMFVTTNGGSSWQKVAAIPVGSKAGITGILFDPAIGGVVNGVTQTIFASSYGNGVYESTNGGSTWTHLTGGPTDVEYAAVSSTGVYYAVGNGNTSLWSYASGTWTEILDNTQSIQSVAVDPSNPNEVVAETPGGGIDISYNGGATWSGWYNSNPVSTDIPWEQAANISPGGTTNGTYMDVGGLAFNPLVANQIIVSGGTGVWNASVPTSGVSNGYSTWETFNDQSVGIENLVANEIIVPPGGNPVLASWDRPFFDISNPNAYPSTYGPVNSDNIVAGWSVDYASSNPSFLVGLADWWGTEESGYSTNGGQTWKNFPTDIPGAGSSFMGGTIAASTPQNIIWAPADKNQPYYTLNGGATWSSITLPGVTSWSGFDWAYYLDQRSVTADRVLANTFYLYYPGQGVFQTTNGGQSWSKVYSGDIGPSWAECFNSTLMSVPGEASNLFYTGGPQGTISSAPAAEPFYRSTNGGATWTAVPNVLDVFTFGFGAAAAGQSYPAIYIVGYVNNVYGIWQSTNNAQSWTNIGTYPLGELDQITTISGDPNHYGEVYVGFAGGGYAYLPSVDPPVTVAYYLAHQAALDAAGTIVIADTAADVSASINALNADDEVTAITLTGTGRPTLALTVAQALNDTNALGAITNASYAIDVTDTPANISANFDALNSDTHVTSIAPRGGGTQTLTLTLAQALNDTRALSILDPFTVTVLGTAVRLRALTAKQIADLSSSGVTLFEASDMDVAFTMAQKQALSAAGIALEQPFRGGSVEVINYRRSGVLKSAKYLGVVDAAYTSYTVDYGTNGEPTRASYSNGMTKTWTYNANGSYRVATAGVTGEPYTSFTVHHRTNGEPTRASYSNGMTKTWTYNPDGSYDAAFQNATGLGYSSFENLHNTAGVRVAKAEDITHGSGDLLLYVSGLKVSSSSGQLNVTTRADAFPLNAHTKEAISATGLNSETFEYASGFGHSSITGLLAGGGASDLIQFNLSMFHGLSSTNTAAQDLADLLSSGAAARSGPNVTITDSVHDVLTLMGVTTSTLNANANSVFKFV